MTEQDRARLVEVMREGLKGLGGMLHVGAYRVELRDEVYDRFVGAAIAAAEREGWEWRRRDG